MLLNRIFALVALLLGAYAIPTTPSSNIQEETHVLDRRADCSIHFNAPMTYYTKGTSPTQTTACGKKLDTSAYWVALPNTMSNPKQYCGWDIFIWVVGKNKVVQATVMDVNATPNDGPTQLDVTPALYKALFGSTSKSGRVDWYLFHPPNCFGV